MAAGLSPQATPQSSRHLLTGKRARIRPALRTLNLARVFPAIVAVAILAGFALRLFLLDRFPLREDEAIYAYWARYGRDVDWLFLKVWPDKPPLFIGALALAFEVWGATPAAARFLNIGASVLTIPVVAVTARRWWGPFAGAVAAVAMSLSPFANSFAPTVYTDPLLVLTGSLALGAAAFSRPFWAGLWLGAAIMTKQQGLLYVPLVATVLAFSVTQRRKDAKVAPDVAAAPRPAPLAGWAAALLFFAGLFAILGPLFWWDSLRWAVAPSPWDLGAQNVGALVLLPPAQWPLRGQAWLAQAWYLQASVLAWCALALLLGMALLASMRLQRRQAWPAWLLFVWSIAFLGLHIMTSVQVWDRYLLPLAPALALLTGWGAATAWPAWRPPAARGIMAAIALVVALMALAPPALEAGAGGLPVGGDHGAYAGLPAALAAVDEAATTGAVLYHRELGWQARFYLYDAIAAGRVDPRWFASATALADNAAKTPHLRRYLVEADWAPARDLPIQLAARRLHLQEVQRSGHFTVYAITEEPQRGAADWRVCRPALPWTVRRLAAAPPQSVAP